LERPDREQDDRSHTPAPTAALRIHLLGRFEVLRDGVPLPPQAWRRRRPADLLKLIALAPNHRLSRDQAIDTLWPDKEPSAGANNLHRALYDLRLVLGGRYVELQGAFLVLSAPASVDVDAFEAAVTAGGAEAHRVAVALYHGDLAPEDPESPWLQSRRRLLRSRFAEVAVAVAHEEVARGAAAEAVTILRRLLAADPAAEEGHRLMMELFASGGSRSQALRQYDEAARALRAAGRGLPGEPLRALRDAIERRELGPAVTPIPMDCARRVSLRLLGTADPPPLRGRAAQLESAFGLIDHGHGVLVLLGEPGVGKTRLAVELARLAHQRGATVLAGAACTLRPAAPFAPFAAAFADEAHENPTAPPDPFAADEGAPSLPPDAARQRLFTAIARTLAAAGRGGPVFLLLDDVHAADESSLDLLHFLALRAATLQLSVVATCRESAVRAGTAIQSALAQLDADRLARGLRLPRLALAASAERLADVLADPPPPDVVACICQVTDGNPLHLEQVVRAWDEGGRVEVAPDPLVAMRARIARLDGAAGRLLQAAAVVGDRFPLDLAAHAAGLDRDEAHAALERAVQARLLLDESAWPRFVHGLLREEVVASLDPARRAALHRAVAEALQAEGERPGGAEPPADQLAWHWREAFENDRAFRHLVAAGHRAVARSGLREALGFHETALAHVSRGRLAGGAEHFELLESVARARLSLGELDGAIDAFRAAAETVGPGGWRPAREQRDRARRCAALALASGGDLDAAQREIDLGLAPGSGQPAEESAGLLLLRARLHWHSGRFEPAASAAEECLAEAERLGQPDLIARASDLLALAHAALGRDPTPPVERSGPVERRHVDPLGDPALDPSLVLWDGAAMRDLPAGELLRLARLELARCRERGDAEGSASPLFAVGSTLLATGELERAAEALTDALARFRAAGSALGEALALERLSVLEESRGKLVEGMELVADAMVAARRAPLRRHLLVRLLVAQARNRLGAGSLHDAEVIAREAADCAMRHGVCSTCEAALRPLQVRIALARDRVEGASSEAAILEGLAAARGGRALLSTARLARARVLGAQGRRDEAVALAVEARAGFEALGRHYSAAFCAHVAVRLGAPREPALEGLLAPDAAMIE
jgi:DNA-binding SARP family transcriptional activator